MKNKIIFKILSLFSVLVLFLSSFMVYGEPVDTSEDKAYKVNDAIYKIIDFEKSSYPYKNSYIFNTGFLKNAQDYDSLRLLVSLSRFGYKDNYSGYGAILKDIVIKSYQTFDKLSPNKSTPWHIISMGLMASGINPNDIKTETGSIDLIKDGVWGRNKKLPLEKDGPEGPMRGLIVMDAYNTIIPEDEEPSYTRETLIKSIMSYQKEDGSFGKSAVISDTELTAIAVTALAPYQHLDTIFSYTRNSDKKDCSYTVGDVIYKALEYLSLNQAEDGSFSNFEKDNVKITSRVLVALCSLGIDPLADTRFIKNGSSLVDALLNTQNENGSVSVSDEDARIKTDTVFALEALVAYSRFLNGLGPVYNFTDCNFGISAKTFTKPDLEKAYKLYVTSDIFSSVDGYEYLIMIIDRAKNSYLNKEDSLYLKALEEKAEFLYDEKIRIKDLNETGKELASPQTTLGTKNTHAVNVFIKQYNSLSVYDKSKIDSYESVIEKKNSMHSKTTAVYVLTFLIGLIIIGLILFLAVFFIKSTPVWDYIYMKFFGKAELIQDDEFDDDDLEMTEDFEFLQQQGELPLPYVDNDDFFEYGNPGDVTAFEDETPYLENDEFLDFISRDRTGEYEDDDDLELPQTEEQPLPYIDNAEFFEYEYPTEEMSIDDDEDFRIY